MWAIGAHPKYRPIKCMSSLNSQAGSPWSVTCDSVTCVSQSNCLSCQTQILRMAEMIWLADTSYAYAS